MVAAVSVQVEEFLLISSNVSFTGNNVVANNSVEWNGGGLSLIDSSILVDGNLTVDSNLAISMNLEVGYGGGMYVKGCTFTTTNTSLLLFENNNADIIGGMAIRLHMGGQVEFSGNSAGYDGGMLVLGDSISIFNEQG